MRCGVIESKHILCDCASLFDQIQILPTKDQKVNARIWLGTVFVALGFAIFVVLSINDVKTGISIIDGITYWAGQAFSICFLFGMGYVSFWFVGKMLKACIAQDWGTLIYAVFVGGFVILCCVGFTWSALIKPHDEMVQLLQSCGIVP